MFAGIGATEFLIIIAFALVLFGAPAVVAFWLGYRAGSKRASGAPTPAPTTPAPTAPAAPAPAAPAPAPEPAAPAEGADAEESQP